jgi:hypothetical protein
LNGKQWIFLAPCSNPAAQKHLSDTIIKGVRLADIEQFLNEDDKRALQNIDVLRIWGNVHGKAREWEDMEKGDVILFYQSGKFTHVGTVFYKVENEELSKRLWSDYEEGKPWRYIYFLQDVREVNIPWDLIRSFSEYDNGFVPIGFTAIRPKGMESILQRYGSIAGLLKAHEVTANLEETDTQCLNLLRSVKADDLVERFVDPQRMMRWTGALKGFSARRKDEDYDAWMAKYDFVALKEIYDFIVELEKTVKVQFDTYSIKSVGGLDPSESAVMCGFRAIQRKMLPQGHEVNMNPHKYNVLKVQLLGNRTMALIGSTGSDYVEPRRQYVLEHKAVWSGWDFRIRPDQKSKLDKQLSEDGTFKVYLHDSTTRGGSGKVRYVGYVDQYSTSEEGIKSPDLTLTPDDEKDYPSPDFNSRTWLRFVKIEELGDLVNTNQFRDFYKDTPIDPRSLQNRFAFIIDSVKRGNVSQEKMMFDPHLKERLRTLSTLLEKKKQIILYGPPGTGKTFAAKQLALYFLDALVTEDQTELKKMFDKAQDTGRVELVQFHPAYSYEDFVEGIRTVSTDKGILYAVQPGILKRFCGEIAVSEKGYFARVKEYREISPSIQANVDLQRYGINRISQATFFDLLKSYGLSQNPNFAFLLNPSAFSGFYVLRLKKESPYADEESSTYHYVSAIPGSKQLTQDLEKGRVAFFYFDRDKGGLFGAGTLEGYERRESKTEKRILIIDEINRGNIAKIFGELIYALEYRGEKIKLQYSGSDESIPEEAKYLAIPENLYIIGTMNTADRSIALVDVALRRRFSFARALMKENPVPK